MQQPDRDEVERLIDQRTNALWAAVRGLTGGVQNYVGITAGTPANAQGATAVATGLIAAVRTTALFSGMFLWYASAVVAASAPADLINTFAVDSQTGTGAFAVTNGAVPGAGGTGGGVYFGPGVKNGNTVIASAAAGTPMSALTGGGGTLVQYTRPVTLGTAAVGDTFSAWGIMQNSITNTPIGRAPFTAGNNVILVLRFGNTNPTNRALTSINMGLFELPL